MTEIILVALTVLPFILIFLSSLHEYAEKKGYKRGRAELADAIYSQLAAIDIPPVEQIGSTWDVIERIKIKCRIMRDLYYDDTEA